MARRPIRVDCAPHNDLEPPPQQPPGKAHPATHSVPSHGPAHDGAGRPVQGAWLLDVSWFFKRPAYEVVQERRGRGSFGAM